MTNAYWNNEKYYENLCSMRNGKCAYYNFFSVCDDWSPTKLYSFTIADYSKI
jgi:hypothetical protein